MALTQKEIINCILAAIMRRIKIDCLATDQARFRKKTTKSGLVSDIWMNLVQGDFDPLRL